jgi:hypothetical protein
MGLRAWNHHNSPRRTRAWPRCSGDVDLDGRIGIRRREPLDPDHTPQNQGTPETRHVNSDHTFQHDRAVGKTTARRLRVHPPTMAIVGCSCDRYRILLYRGRPAETVILTRSNCPRAKGSSRRTTSCGRARRHCRTTWQQWPIDRYTGTRSTPTTRPRRPDQWQRRRAVDERDRTVPRRGRAAARVVAPVRRPSRRSRRSSGSSATRLPSPPHPCC